MKIQFQEIETENRERQTFLVRIHSCHRAAPVPEFSFLVKAAEPHHPRYPFKNADHMPISAWRLPIVDWLSFGPAPRAIQTMFSIGTQHETMRPDLHQEPLPSALGDCLSSIGYCSALRHGRSKPCFPFELSVSLYLCGSSPNDGDHPPAWCSSPESKPPAP